MSPVKSLCSLLSFSFRKPFPKEDTMLPLPVMGAALVDVLKYSLLQAPICEALCLNSNSSRVIVNVFLNTAEQLF